MMHSISMCCSKSAYTLLLDFCILCKTYQARVIKLFVSDDDPVWVARYNMLPLTQPTARFEQPAFSVAQHAHCPPAW
jgi:hypothetical protein